MVLPNNPPPVVLPNRLVPVPVPNVVPNAGLFCVPNRPPVLVVPNVPSVPDEKIKYKYAIDGSNEDGSGRWQLKVYCAWVYNVGKVATINFEKIKVPEKCKL